MALPSFERPSTTRSANMRAIRSGGNRTTEWRLRSLLMRAGVRGWRLRQPSVAGFPDFLFDELRVVVFVDGSFWHGCPRCGHTPKRNRAYWSAKIRRNKARDARVTGSLRRSGYSVVRLRECSLKNGPEKCLTRVQRVLQRRAAASTSTPARGVGALPSARWASSGDVPVAVEI